MPEQTDTSYSEDQYPVDPQQLLQKLQTYEDEQGDIPPAMQAQQDEGGLTWNTNTTFEGRQPYQGAPPPH